MQDEDMAEEIFSVWDTNMRRYLMFDDFADNMIGLGLAPDANSVRKIMIALKGVNSNFPDQIDLKEFRRIFEPSRLGKSANQKICEEFKAVNADFAHQQFIRIIGSQAKADLKRATEPNIATDLNGKLNTMDIYTSKQ